MADATESIIEKYENDCRIVKETRGRGQTYYHYEGPMGRVQSFNNADDARLYADVQTITGGFREHKTGERGAPPTVARSREDVLMAYYAAQPTMSIEWVVTEFNLPEDRIREYIGSLRTRAEQKRAD